MEINSITEKKNVEVNDGTYHTILCVGAKSIHFKKELTDHQYLCIHFDDLEQAASLLRNALREGGFLPEAIIMDVDLEAAQLNKFLTFLNRSALLRDLPLFLFVYQLNQKDLEKFSNIKLIDDIYTSTSNAKEIVERIGFLKKFKKKIKQTSAESSVKVIEDDFKFDINQFFKRLVDIVVSGVLILLLLPFFIIIALAIAIESRGPIIYSSKRAGKGFKVFKFYKFRSMYVDADSMIKKLSHLNQYKSDDPNETHFFKISNDPRVTKVGAFLRNTSIDELPQLFNILIGDMSLVGNRPLPLYEANSITTDVYSKRFLAPAGLTGLWQVSKRGKKDMSTEERLDLDITYAEKWSFMSDFGIMLKTPKALIQKDNV